MDAQLQERYRRETAHLVARRGPYGALLFLAGVGLAGVLEYWYHPERLPYLLLFFTLELAICAAANGWSRRRRRRDARVDISWAASIALIGCVTAYGRLAGTSVGALAFLFVVFELTTALVFPWGALRQAVMAGVCAVLYATLLHSAVWGLLATGSDGALPFAYALYAVVAGGLVSVLGAAFLERQRLGQFVQREQLDQHLLTFRELTRAFRGFDPQHIVYLVCRATLQTFGLRRLWVAWPALGSGRAHGYLVQRGREGSAWEPLVDAQPLWRWVTEWEIDARAFLSGASDSHTPAMLRHSATKSLLCIPLQFEGEYLGALVGDRNGAGVDLGERELALASVLANAASIALVNAQLYQRAATASDEKSLLLARIAHELRNPLQALLWELDSAADGSGAHPPALDRALQSALMTLDLVKELQDFGEVETRRLVANPEPVNLVQALDNLQATALALIEQRPIEYRTTVAPDAEVLVTDPIRLRQIVGNLISNAVKFTPRGTIAVDARRVNGDIEISVRDTGVGIAGPELASIFSPFYRGSARTVTRARGMGLGLAIAQDLAKLLGGRIDVESTAGEGSTFRLVLPHTLANEPETADTVPDLRAATILLIDDDAEWRRDVADALRRAGAHVAEASGGVAGLRRARELEPDAIILDLGLPDIAGTEILLRLQADRALARIPVLIATAEHDAATERRCRTIGCSAFFAKPYSTGELIRIVAPLVRRSMATGTESADTVPAHAAR